MEIKNYENLLNDSSFIAALRKNKLCLFIGAGVAYNIGMPNWWGLAASITDLCLKEKLITHSDAKTLESIKDPLIVISFCVQEIENKNKTKELDDLLNQIFICTPKEKLDRFRREGQISIYERLIEICKNKKALIVLSSPQSLVQS